MARALRFLVVFASTSLACASALAQKPVAPEPHLALDELVKEYKRLGLPLPPPNAELVRVKTTNYPDQLGFRTPTKPGEYPVTMIGADTRSEGENYEVVKPEPAALLSIEPQWVSDFLCLAIPCRERGWNEFATLLFARAQEAIATPVPVRWKEVYLPIKGLSNQAFKVRDNGWKLHASNSSALKELRHVASSYWSGQVMAKESIRKEALRHLKELAPESEDVRDLELTLAPRKSKPGTVESLIDDLTDYGFSRKWGFEPLGEDERGEAAYRKLVEMGFDAVPALLDAIRDKRLTRRFHVERGGFGFGGPQFYSIQTRVGQVIGQILNDISGHELSKDIWGGPWLNEKQVRVWWEKARKEGEEKWLVARAEAEPGDEGSLIEDANGWTYPPANRVIFRSLGTKYPNRLGEVYRTVLRKKPELGTRALADEVAASKLPRAEKLALLVEGAEHKRLVHRNAALAVLAKLDPPLFRKHLLATLKKLPPDIEKGELWRSPQSELASFVSEIDDAAYWDALTEIAKQSLVKVRIEILRALYPIGAPDPDKPTRRQLLQFLIRFLADDSSDGLPPLEKADVDAGNYHTPAERVQHVATEVLAGQLGIKLPYDPRRGPLSYLFIRAAVAKAAMEELMRLKK